VDIPLPWERLLWSGRPSFQLGGRERYALTDLRLVRQSGSDVEEILLRDIGEIQCRDSRFGGIAGATIIVRARTPFRPPIVLRRVRKAQQLAALLEWLASEPDDRRDRLDTSALGAALTWSPRGIPNALIQGLGGVAAAFLLVSGIAIVIHGTAVPPSSVYAADDSIYPGGHKRPDDEIVHFMEQDVMPWARAALGPLKGGPDRITCDTCHGRQPDPRTWAMPAVAALPQPDVKDRGWEQFGGQMDAQMRNAIYGYLANSDKQVKAAYMREVVMPGMARLLHRPAYDFTQSYEYNRSRLAFGCYHCHRVS
jgi:hypothetical protein